MEDVPDLTPEPWVIDLIAGSPIASVISNPRLPDNPLVACNDAFVELTGYPREEIIGRNCRFLKGPGTEQSATQALRQGIANRERVLAEMLNFKKDGTPFRNAVLVAPLFDTDRPDDLIYFLGSQMEVPENATGPTIGRRMRATEAVANLSKRQLEVLTLVARGLRNKQIAFELGLAEKTVKMHRGITMERLGTRTAAEMIRVAVEAGL